MNIACDTHLNQMTALDVQCHSLMFHLRQVKNGAAADDYIAFEMACEN